MLRAIGLHEGNNCHPFQHAYMHSTVSAFASSSGSILRLRLRYVFEPLHCMPFIASFKNGVRTSTDPYGKDSHLGFFVNVQVGPQTAPAIPHGSPYPYHPSTTRTSSSLPSAPYPLYTNRPPTTSSLSPSRPTPPPPPTRQSTSRLSARATRMLLSLPAALEKYDIPSPPQLRRTPRSISIIGRRGQP